MDIRSPRDPSVALAAPLLAATLLLAGCEGPTATSSSPAARPPDRVETTGNPGELQEELPIVDLHVRDLGVIRIELLAHEAPQTVASFLRLASEGFYAGTTFHRVIPGFMIQGGDPNTKNRDPRDDGQGGPGYTLPDEFNDVPHRRGIVSMANTGRANSAGSQFFILVADRPDLDGHYTAFGRVLAGMDVVDAIARVERDQYGRYGPFDRPLEDVVIEKIELVQARS
jgi:peptidyl-prolyl cis-trans isomerase B (cyclophilin B)